MLFIYLHCVFDIRNLFLTAADIFLFKADTIIFFSSQTQQRRSREKQEDREQGVKLSVREKDTTFLPPFLFPLAAGPSVLQVYQPRLKTVKCSKRTGENSTRRFRVPDELPVSDAKQLLQQTKTLLWNRKQRLRLANRMQIQDLIDGLDGLVMIPP